MTASVTRPWSWSSTTGSTVSAQCLMSLGLASQTGFHRQYFSFERSPMWETGRCDVVALKWEWGGASVPPGSFTPSPGVWACDFCFHTSHDREVTTSRVSDFYRLQLPLLENAPSGLPGHSADPTGSPDCREASHCPHLGSSWLEYLRVLLEIVRSTRAFDLRYIVSFCRRETVTITSLLKN